MEKGQEMIYVGANRALHGKRLKIIQANRTHAMVSTVDGCRGPFHVQIADIRPAIPHAYPIPQVFNRQGKDMMQNKASNWEFKISRESQIDYDRIAQDLSWDNPLALVTANGDELVQVVVFAPLFRKANTLGMYQYPGVAMKTRAGTYYLTLESGKSIPVVKQWAHDVRQSAWDDAYKATVKVQLLDV